MQPPPPAPSPAPSRFCQQVTTNADGVANATIDLRDLPPANVTRPGDTLDVKATWIGPTREAIIVSKSVRCGFCGPACA